MTTTRMPATPITDRDRQRACRWHMSADSRLLESVIREVAEADRRALTSIDFWLPR